MILLSLGATWVSAQEEPQRASPVDFDRDVRPILSDKCYLCHGQDESRRQAGLRLDTAEGALASISSRSKKTYAVVPGNPASSLLLHRVQSADPDVRMPPKETGKRLSSQEIDVLERWIREGAPYAGLWSLVPPTSVPLPAVDRTDWPRHDLDRFVLQRLEEKGLLPARDADRRTLARRVSLDLTGLPPHPDTVEEFVHSRDPAAYERLVDDLFASPRYAEHMARHWLDAARYGDTHGLHLDNYREMWPYRDWVIGAFQRNLPYDRFVIDQLAGDLLPNTSLDQQIASGFNRCHVTTNEGGSIAEEVYVRNVVDRTNTASSVFMGLTLGCASCHDHKFDPFTQREYYQLFAFFNNLDADPLDGNAKAHPPVIAVPSLEQKARVEELDGEIQHRAASLEGPIPEIDAAQSTWTARWEERVRNRWQSLAITNASARSGTLLTLQADGSLLASGNNPDKQVYEVSLHLNGPPTTAFRVEVLTDPSLVRGGPGRSTNGNIVLSEVLAEWWPSDAPDAKPTPLRWADARADHAQEKFPARQAIDGKKDGDNGWGLDGHHHHAPREIVLSPETPLGGTSDTNVRLKFVFSSPYAAHAFGRFRISRSTLPEVASVIAEPWRVIGPFEAPTGGAAYERDPGPETDLALDRGHEGLRWETRPNLTDGKVHMLSGDISATYLHRVLFAPTARRFVVSLGSDDAIKVWLNGKEVLANNVARGVAPDQESLTLDLRAGANDILMKIVNFGGAFGFYWNRTRDVDGPDIAVASILAKPAQQRTKEDEKLLTRAFRREHSPAWTRENDRLETLRRRREALVAEFPTTLIYKERTEPRPAHLFERGQYDAPGPIVERLTPKALPVMASDLPRNRLGLARWLLSKDHPLTSRVIVNRLWQQVFGRGLVETAEDFGTQGTPPSHPELLDWLAIRFRESGWDIKAFLRMLVTSRTYAQSSRVDPETLRRDPENKLLSRAPRYRLDAEVLRDQALFLGGLLVEKLGGPSVKPPQPDGLWFSVGYSGSNTVRFKADEGHEKIHRRSLYTFWKRTSPPPQMSTFDAPSRESPCLRRERTNTPLQALLLLNDPQYVEAARSLAARILTEAGSTDDERASFGFELCTQRPIDAYELQVLLETLQDHRRAFARNEAAARVLVSAATADLEGRPKTQELASWTLISNLLLNLDEVVTRE